LISKHGFNLPGLVSTYRLKKTLERLELSEEKVEIILEEIFTYSFRNNLENKETIHRILETVKTAKEMGIPICNIMSFVKSRKIELEYIEMRIQVENEKINELYQSYGVTQQELEEFRMRQPMFEKTIAAEANARAKEEENHKLRQQISTLKEENFAKDRKIYNLQKEKRDKSQN
jgi:hypothetical protein